MRIFQRQIIVGLGLLGPTLLATAQNNSPTARSLVDNHGSITAGELTFSNFQVPSTLPYQHPQGALPNDGSDLAVQAVLKPDGSVSLVLTFVDASHLEHSLSIDARRGSSNPSDLVRNLTFDVTSTNPNRLVHSVRQGHGSGSSSSGDASVANLSYYLEPGTGAPGLLSTDFLNGVPGPALLPGGDSRSVRIGNELELVSNHNRGGSTGTASVDSIELNFALTGAGVQAAPGAGTVTAVAANAVTAGTTGTGIVQLSAPAGAGGVVVTLTSANPAQASIPASLIVPQGARTATFAIRAGNVTGNVTSVGLTAATSTSSVSGFVQVFAATSVPPVSTPAAGMRFVPMTPCRISDTRNPNGAFGGPAMNAQEIRTLTLTASTCGIPSTALAYALNVTVVPQGRLSWLTVWPAGQQQPTVSTLNSYDGRIKANAAIVPAGTSGAVSLYVTDRSHVIVDINGYFVNASDPTGLAYYPLHPCRVADTRNGTGGRSLAAGEERSLAMLTSACGLPSTAQAYSVNFTAIPRSRLSYLSVWPTGQTRPTVSTLNSFTGVVTANAAIVPAGQAGDISVYATDDADLVLDIDGYFAPPAAGGMSLYAATPCRVFDSRGRGGSDDAVAGSESVVLRNVCGLPANAAAAVLNATVVPSGSMPYLTLWPEVEDQPTVSTLNAYDSSVTSNMAVVPTSSGTIKVYTAGRSHVILDLSTYFAP